MNRPYDLDLGLEVDKYIKKITFDKIEDFEYKTYVVREDTTTIKVTIKFELSTEVQIDDWQINICPAFTPTFHWAPHLTPTNIHIIPQHCFRSPALIASRENRLLTVIPDLDILSKAGQVKWYLDLDAEENKLTIGMGNSEVKEHVLFVKRPGMILTKGTLEIGFYIMFTENKLDIFNPWRKVLSFLWDNYGQKLYKEGQPLNGPLDCYIQHTYLWAFKNWKESIWQEFAINEKKVGAPVFIVNVTQSPNYTYGVNERETRSIWNQAWFSSLRSAQGLYRYGKRNRDNDLLNKALLTKELALSAPYHVLDMSWTALLMLRWYEELEKDERLKEYSLKYADSLAQLQDERGFFPAWINCSTFKPLGVLDDSPETSLSVTFMLTAYKLTKDSKYLESALKAMEAVSKEIIFDGRWEDFETYWSCSSYGRESQQGKRIKRNNMYKQCNFSIYWTAEALYHCYKITKDNKFLKLGQRCLDEMLMTQASWQPPYLYVNTLGGFGVMNCDGEWNDARQSLFAELILNYGIELNMSEYIQRGLASMRASFVMMYCPENTKIKEQWEKRWPFFNEKDYGFMMENYGHEGVTNKEGLGIGEFTIYDWGNGAAAEAYLRIVDHLGMDFILNN